MKREATAQWTGDLKKGKGTLSTSSKVLNSTPYTFASRFENGAETNPEELIAAAHAGCFTMAVTARLTKAGFTAEKLTTGASLTLEQVDGNWKITTVQLNLVGQVPGVDKTKWEEIVQDAKENCPVSKVLNAKIELSARLEK